MNHTRKLKYYRIIIIVTSHRQLVGVTLVDCTPSYNTKKRFMKISAVFAVPYLLLWVVTHIALFFVRKIINAAIE